MSQGAFFLQTLCRAVAPIPSPHLAAQAIATHSAALQPAVQPLLAVVKQLRSPQSGWPAQLPQTPENMTPYVSEEIQEVIEALQAISPANEAAPPLWLQTDCLIELLIAEMLWSVACSDYETMRLLEGVKAIKQAEASAQEGILRLIVVLSLEVTGRKQLLDLVTQAAPHRENWLSQPVGLQIHDSDLCHQPLQSDQLLAQLQQRIQRTTPAVGPLLEGLDVDLLQPLQPWQRGKLQLNLQLEFIPQRAGSLPPPAAAHPPAPADSPPANRVPLNTPLADAAAVLVSGAEPASSPPPVWMTLVEEAWIQQFAQTVLEHSLLALLPEVAQNDALAPSSQNPAFFHWLLAETSALVEGLKDNRQLFQPAFFQQPILLCDLLSRLLWSVSRSTPTAMRLLGGVAAQQLQPDGVWQAGNLRLQAKLQIQLVQVNWQFDLSTGLVTAANRRRPDSAIWLREMIDLPTISRLPALEQQIQQQIQRRSPELAGFLNGTAIEVLTSETGLEAQKGQLRLTLDLQFIADA
ncbi:hypothetical protein [Almyronema epifaneia]|uniref:Molecular chaperone n=1 Tax=Almyronema epifaneia S1 TaxID=2991925 RepID=A0ABW6III7_9CYAN